MKKIVNKSVGSNSKIGSIGRVQSNSILMSMSELTAGISPFQSNSDRLMQKVKDIKKMGNKEDLTRLKMTSDSTLPGTSFAAGSLSLASGVSENVVGFLDIDPFAAADEHEQARRKKIQSNANTVFNRGMRAMGRA